MTHFARALALAALIAAPALAQSPFGGFKHDETQPIEIAANSLEVQEAQQIAIFRGEVVAGQGTSAFFPPFTRPGPPAQHALEARTTPAAVPRGRGRCSSPPSSGSRGPRVGP